VVNCSTRPVAIPNDESSGREEEVEDVGRENFEVVKRDESSNGGQEDSEQDDDEEKGVGQDDEEVGDGS
jgi:hypothetical protein